MLGFAPLASAPLADDGVSIPEITAVCSGSIALNGAAQSEAAAAGNGQGALTLSGVSFGAGHAFGAVEAGGSLTGISGGVARISVSAASAFDFVGMADATAAPLKIAAGSAVYLDGQAESVINVASQAASSLPITGTSLASSLPPRFADAGAQITLSGSSAAQIGGGAAFLGELPLSFASVAFGGLAAIGSGQASVLVQSDAVSIGAASSSGSVALNGQTASQIAVSADLIDGIGIAGSGRAISTRTASSSSTVALTGELQALSVGAGAASGVFQLDGDAGAANANDGKADGSIIFALDTSGAVVPLSARRASFPADAQGGRLISAAQQGGRLISAAQQGRLISGRSSSAT